MRVCAAREVIEHVRDPPAFVAACCALVRPGGGLVVSTVNRTPASLALAIVAAEVCWLGMMWHMRISGLLTTRT